MVAAPAGPPATPPGQCLLVSLPPKDTAAGAWHARVVSPDGEVQDFDSPFELVRYLFRQTEPSRREPGADDPDSHRGLR